MFPGWCLQNFWFICKTFCTHLQIAMYKCTFYRLKVTITYYSLVVTFSLGHFLCLCDPVSSSVLSSSHVPEDELLEAIRSHTRPSSRTQSFQ